MFFGWIACNAVFAMHAMHVMLTNARQFDSLHFLTEMIAIGIYSGIVIFAAWLVVFWPVDVMVSNDSRLRHPGKAAVCGFLAVFLPYYSIMMGYCLFNDLIHSWADFARYMVDPWTRNALPFTAGALVTGTVAAFTRCWRDPIRKKLPHDHPHPFL
jgi:hypothetical protein